MDNPEHFYLFRHALVRDAAFGLLLPGQRARLHLLAAQTHASHANAGPDPATAYAVVQHALAAQDMGDEETRDQAQRLEFPYLKAAARHARDRFDHAKMHRLALHWADHPQAGDPEKALALLWACSAAIGLLDLPRAEALGLRAADHCREKAPQTLAAALAQLGGIVLLMGHNDRAETLLRQAAGDGTGPGAATRGAMRNLGHTLAQRGDPEALLWLNRAVESARQAGDTPDLISALNVRGVYHMNDDKPALARADFDLALQTARQTANQWHEAGILANLGTLAMHQGSFADALQQLRQARVRAELLGHARLLESLGNDVARALIGLGRWDDARAELDQAEHRCVESGAAMTLQRLAETRALLERACARHPGQPPA